MPDPEPGVDRQDGVRRPRRCLPVRLDPRSQHTEPRARRLPRRTRPAVFALVAGLATRVEDYFTVVNYDQRASLLWAYVGVGQVISGPENEEESFRHAMRSAVADRNEQAISELRALGEYPGDEPLTVERIVTCRRWAQYYGGLSAHRSDYAYFTESQELSPYYTDADLGLIGVGQRATMPAVLPALLGFDARDQTVFEVPMLQFLGRHDWTTPTGPVARWLETVTAPSTHVVWFENSAHLCMFEEPGKFLVSLVTHALPHAVEAADARKDGSTDSPVPA